jgi:peptide chain release factor 3
MLVDHAKGVESRTLKLFEVCRMRKLPIVTFMNKLDRDGLDPLALIDEIASTLNLKVAPISWPVGMGRDFKGVVLLPSRDLLLYSGGKHGQVKLETERIPFADAVDKLGKELHEEVSEQLDLVEMAGDPWDKKAYLAGELSPIFWGSAMTNFGVEPLLAFLAEHAATPQSRVALDANDDEVELFPEEEDFTGFIFKIQANMNPRHRDRLAFIRVVSGKFERGMETRIGRSGERIRMAKPHSFMAQERSIVDEAWPGDIVGLYDPGKLRIGDTISSGRVLRFSGIPRFAPEHFARLILADPGKRKQLDAGLTQLAHEGVIQVFTRPDVGRQEPWLGAVGMLQFEVFKERLKNEYRVHVKIEPLPYRVARWVGGGEKAEAWLQSRRDFKIVLDRHNRPVMLAESKWALNYALSNAPDIAFYDVEPL